MRPKTHQRGFTLIELVMVIVIMGVIGGMVSIFMKSPIDAYIDSARRAGLTDVADTAVRRMARDIRKALPNSIRTPITVPPNPCLEFIPTKTGGRYRTQDLVAGIDTSLNFAAADGTFNMLGRNSTLPADQQILANDVIAVANLGFDVGDAYVGSNTAVVTGVVDGTETTINMATTTFNIALALPNRAFQVIPANENVVAFVCAGGNLRRTARAFAAPVCPANGAILARNVGVCNFVYNGSDLQRNALVQLSITFTDSNETVSLYHEVHVNNTP